MVPVLPAGVHVADPENGVVAGTAARTGPGNIASGPTANIATNNLRRDNLTGDALFILIAKQFVTNYA
jgi:hypothetical protein